MWIALLESSLPTIGAGVLGTLTGDVPSGRVSELGEPSGLLYCGLVARAVAGS